MSASRTRNGRGRRTSTTPLGPHHARSRSSDGGCRTTGTPNPTHNPWNSASDPTQSPCRPKLGVNVVSSSISTAR
jgi:hypothetical protein